MTVNFVSHELMPIFYPQNMFIIPNPAEIEYGCALFTFLGF